MWLDPPACGTQGVFAPKPVVEGEADVVVGELGSTGELARILSRAVGGRPADRVACRHAVVLLVVEVEAVDAVRVE